MNEIVSVLPSIIVLIVVAYAIRLKASERKAKVSAQPKQVVRRVIPLCILEHYTGAKWDQYNGERILIVPIAGQIIGFDLNGNIAYQYTKLGQKVWDTWTLDAFCTWAESAPKQQVQQGGNNKGGGSNNQQQPQLKGGAVKKVLSEQECDDANYNNDPFSNQGKERFALPQGWHWTGGNDQWFPARNKQKQP